MVDQLRRTLLKGIASLGTVAVISPLMPGISFAATSGLADAELMELRRRAARLANYATFGANEDEVNRIIDTGWETWVDQQLALPITPLYPSATLNTDKLTVNQFYGAWWTNALAAPDQLHQRVGFALSQWFVISSDHPFLSGRSWTVINFYDRLLQGIDGNFTDLLNQVSTHPAMCAYLSSLYNAKADPVKGTVADENYAREVMQLFSCGPEKRHRNGNFAVDEQGQAIANYDEQDVQEMARVFTGIGIKDASAWGKETGNWLSPVIEYPEYHDSGSKQLMGQTIPAGLSLFEDIGTALGIIIEQRGNSVAGNFSRFMIQRLTLSNPKYTYVRDVAIAFKDSNWDIKTLVRAILLHPDAIDGRSDNRSETGRLKEPLLWYAGARRAIAPPRDQALAPLTGPLFDNAELRTGEAFNQKPLGAFSVFGFFPWDYQPESIRREGTGYIDYVYPESYLYNWNNITTVSNKLWGNVIKKDDDVVRFMEVLISGASNEEFSDFVLDKILFGNHRPALKVEMVALLDQRGPVEYKGKVRDALMLATTCPDSLIINHYQEA